MKLRGEAGIARETYDRACEHAVGLQTVIATLAWVLGQREESPIGEHEIEHFATELY